MIARNVAVLLLSVFTSVFAVGRTAVITLEFPHGAENCGMGEVGVSLADNINSVFWNPAALPAIGEKLSVQYLYATSYESLLPPFNIPDLWHSDTIHAIFISNLFKDIDFGASYSTNFLNFGTNELFDYNGIAYDSVRGYETVRSLAVGLRYLDCISLGFALKDFESRLAPGMNSIPHDGTAQGQVFDFGVRLEKKFTFADMLTIHPALGFALHSFPQDSVRYMHSYPLEEADPLPLKRWYGASINANLLDLVGFTFAKEREYSVVEQEFTDHEGYKIQLTPFFALLHGNMIDSAGQRFEETKGYAVTFNYQQTLNALIKYTGFFDPKASDRIAGLNRWTDSHFLKPNLYIQYAKSRIHGKEWDYAREGQTRTELCIGVSLIGDLSALSLKKWCSQTMTQFTTVPPQTNNPAPAISKTPATQSAPKNSTSLKSPATETKITPVKADKKITEIDTLIE